MLFERQVCHFGSGKSIVQDAKRGQEGRLHLQPSGQLAQKLKLFRTEGKVMSFPSCILLCRHRFWELKCYDLQVAVQRGIALWTRRREEQGIDLNDEMYFDHGLGVPFVLIEETITVFYHYTILKSPSCKTVHLQMIPLQELDFATI
jgi:hypothetical protein